MVQVTIPEFKKEVFIPTFDAVTSEKKTDLEVTVPLPATINIPELKDIKIDDEDVSIGENVFRTGVGALRDVAQGVLDVSEWIESKTFKQLPSKFQAGFIKDKDGETKFLYGDEYVQERDRLAEEGVSGITLPKVEEPTYFGGSFARDVGGFLIPFSKLKYITPTTKLGKAAEITSRGVVAEQLAFSPYEQRLSNLAAEHGPDFSKPVAEFLKSDPEDTENQARFKMAIEGAAIGSAIESIGFIIKGAKNLKKKGGDTKPLVDDLESAKPEKSDIPKPKGEEQNLNFGAEKETETFAGNINLNKIDSSESAKEFIFDIGKQKDFFKEARRGRVKFGSQGEELAKLARETGLSEDKLLKRKVGEAFNAETAYEARRLNAQSAENLVELAKKARSVDASDVDLMNFEKALSRHATIQEQIAGITAEAGRALRSFREMVSSTGEIRDKLIKDYIAQKGGKEKIEKVAEYLSELDTPESIAKFSTKVHKATTMDMVQEAWINSLLSSPSTHIVNTLSNLLVAATRIPEYTLAAGMGIFRKGPDKVSFKELTARTFGSIYGFIDGLRVAGKAVALPESVADPLTKLELRKQKSIPGIFGEAFRIPGRLLVAEDVLFKGVGYRQELWGRAFRQADKEGKGFKRAWEIMQNPEKNFPKIHLDAQDIARYQTFTNQLGTIGKGIQKAIQEYPWLRFIAPFVRTPINIVKYAFERTPLGLKMESYKKAIQKGGAEADIARAKLLFGGMVIGSTIFIANGGTITGRGPSNWREQQILRQTGWQPYSIKIGDTYYGYNRFEPIGILLGLSADMAEIYKYVQGDFQEEKKYSKLATQISAAFTENITNKTFLTGLSETIQMITNPDRYGEKTIQKFLGSFVPTISYYMRKKEDPVIRDAQSATDVFYNRISGERSSELPALRNVFGEIKEYSKTYSPEWTGELGKTFSPIMQSPYKDDVVFDELVKLEIVPSLPSRKIGGIDLTPEQYEELMGTMLDLQTKEILKRIIQSDSYKKIRFKSDKIELIEDIIKGDQRKAKELLMIKHPIILKEQIKEQIKEIRNE